MAYEKLMFGVSVLKNRIYLFRTPKQRGIMPDARRDMTDECLGAVMHTFASGGKHMVTTDDDELLLYSNDPVEIEELGAVHDKYVKAKKDVEVMSNDDQH